MTDVPQPPKWEVEEFEPGKWRVLRDGKTYNASPWADEAKAMDALGYFAWVAGGGSAD